MFWALKKIDDTGKSVNFFDILQALGSFDRWIRDEKKNGNDVSVNISTGNKIVSLALAMSVLKNSAKIFYFVPRDISPEQFGKPRRAVNEEGYGTKEPRDFIEIPQFPVDYLQGVPLGILIALSKLGGNVSSLTDLVKQMFPKLSTSEEIRSKRVEMSEKIRQLESLGYVKN